MDSAPYQGMVARALTLFKLGECVLVEVPGPKSAAETFDVRNRNRLARSDERGLDPSYFSLTLYVQSDEHQIVAGASLCAGLPDCSMSREPGRVSD